eukprot:jgi/Bigna1/61156/fgenesh1_kg.18_\
MNATIKPMPLPKKQFCWTRRKITEIRLLKLKRDGPVRVGREDSKRNKREQSAMNLTLIWWTEGGQVSHPRNDN